MYTGRHVLASEIYPSAQGPLGRRDPYGAPSRRHTRSSPPGGRTGYNLGGGGGRAGWTPDGADPSERCAQNMTPDSSPRLHLVLPARRVLSKPGQRPGPVLGAILRPRLRRTLVTYRLFVLARNPRPPSHESKGITPSGDFTPQLHPLVVVFLCAYTSAELSAVTDSPAASNVTSVTTSVTTSGVTGGGGCSPSARTARRPPPPAAPAGRSACRRHKGPSVSPAYLRNGPTPPAAPAAVVREPQTARQTIGGSRSAAAGVAPERPRAGRDASRRRPAAHGRPVRERLCLRACARMCVRGASLCVFTQAPCASPAAACGRSGSFAGSCPDVNSKH